MLSSARASARCWTGRRAWEGGGGRGGGGGALALVAQKEPDVVLMDIAMPGINGLEATAEIKRRWPDVQVIALTVHDNDEYFFQMITAGAAGYVLKGADPSELRG